MTELRWRVVFHEWWANSRGIASLGHAHTVLMHYLASETYFKLSIFLGLLFIYPQGISVWSLFM